MNQWLNLLALTWKNMFIITNMIFVCICFIFIRVFVCLVDNFLESSLVRSPKTLERCSANESCGIVYYPVDMCVGQWRGETAWSKLFVDITPQWQNKWAFLKWARCRMLSGKTYKMQRRHEKHFYHLFQYTDCCLVANK